MISLLQSLQVKKKNKIKMSLTLKIFLLSIQFGMIFATRPAMIPNVDEIMINEADSLEITCYFNSTMKFIMPPNQLNARTTYATITQKETVETKDAKYTISLHKTSVSLGDAGWYGCTKNDTHVDEKYHNQPDVKWTYVFVKSNLSYFVEEVLYNVLVGNVGKDLLIPCRPVSPTYPVELYKYLNQKTPPSYYSPAKAILIPVDDRIKFDVKAGFTIKNLKSYDGGIYYCSITLNGSQHTQEPYKVTLYE